MVTFENGFGSKFKRDLEDALNRLENPVGSGLIGDGTLPITKLKNYIYPVLVDNAIEINLKDKKIYQRNRAYVVHGNNYWYTIDYNSAAPQVFDLSSLNPGQSSLKFYLDINDNNKIKAAAIDTDIGTNPIFAYLYYESLLTLNPKSVYLIDVNGDRKEASYNIKTSQIKNNLVPIMHRDSIEINFQTRKIKLLRSLYIYEESNHNLVVNLDGFVDIDISSYPMDSTDYTSYALYVDMEVRKLKFGKMADMKGRCYLLTKVYQQKVYDNAEGIRVIDKNGKKVNRLNEPKDLQDFAYLYQSNQINIDTVNKQVIIENQQHMIFPNRYVLIQPQTVPYTDVEPTTYLRKLFINKDTGEIVVRLFNSDVKDENLALICMWRGTGANATVVPTFGNEKRIKIDGLKFPERNESNDVSYDWATNKFVLPSELYLLCGIDYSILAQNFCYNKFNNKPNLLFELSSPIKTETFRDSCSISSPIPVNLLTRFAGVYNNDLTNSLGKDITLRFADPKTKQNKNPKVLLIGDSITNANGPFYVKYWLEKFGFTPTMIGTVDNGHDNYGYGIEGGTTKVKGEGRGGWRLTDYTGTTKRKDGTIYLKPDNPFWNPNTQIFDFTYYMNANSFDGVDYVIIMLGTNDITGFSHELETENIAQPTMEEILAYMPVEYKKMIDSIHQFNPNIKIGIIPPPLAGRNDDFNSKQAKFAEMQQYHFDKKINNVYALGNYLATGKFASKTYETTPKPPIDSLNKSYRLAISPNVHDAGNAQMIHGLWSASWIINQSE
ncbi:SGNH/GDSL hydrolase family protein [Bacillus sp. FSL R12-0069]|uniref:SGNH/GDSL hydrolase family protein n=1 Tax=Bacillus sp. FSL R12-0069 TaxID=2975342 RepID=UPI0030FC1F6B